MKSLIIHDKSGYIILHGSGDVREPIGVPFMWTDIPVGKRGVRVDLSVTPHALILEDIPPTETDILKRKVDAQELALMELAEIIAGGAA